MSLHPLLLSRSAQLSKSPCRRSVHHHALPSLGGAQLFSTGAAAGLQELVDGPPHRFSAAPDILDRCTFFFIDRNPVGEASSKPELPEVQGGIRSDVAASKRLQTCLRFHSALGSCGLGLVQDEVPSASSGKPGLTTRRQSIELLACLPLLLGKQKDALIAPEIGTNLRAAASREDLEALHDRDLTVSRQLDVSELTATSLALFSIGRIDQSTAV